MIPGMTGPCSVVSGAVVPALLDVTIFSNTTANAASIVWPGGLLWGDVAVLFDSAGTQSGSSSLGSPPTGFTGIVALVSTPALHVHRVSYKVLDGTENGSISGLDGPDEELKRLCIYRGANRPILGVIEGTIKQSNDDGTLDLRPINLDGTAHAGLYPRLVFACIQQVQSDGNPNINFSTQVPAFNLSQHLQSEMDNKNFDFEFRVGQTLYARADAGGVHTVNAGTTFLSGGVLAFT